VLARSAEKNGISGKVMGKITGQRCRIGLKYVIGPDGSPLSVNDLPSPDTARWVIRKKAEVVCAVLGGLISLEDVCDRYDLTVGEFLNWKKSLEEHGIAGLRVTRMNQYQS
jgi:hypothetical protein